MDEPNSRLPVPLDPGALFHFEDGRPSFEDLARENGIRHWSARQLMELLGYKSWDSFWPVINKAIGVCTTIGADVQENFKQSMIVEGESKLIDFALSKFGCYLVAMNGDTKKPAVAKAQAYFATLAEAFQSYVQSAEDVERVDIRREVAGHERALSGIAFSHGVQNYAFFQDKGYRGLYNMTLNELRALKGDPSRGKSPLLDFMGKRELAANLFRITETEARIQAQDIRGQKPLETAALEVGRSVRRAMQEGGAPPPESLPLETDIKLIRSDLKKTNKGLKKAENK